MYSPQADKVLQPMSLFDLIRYPVNPDTNDFNHIPDSIWIKYIEARKGMSSNELSEENNTFNILRSIILEHEE